MQCPWKAKFGVLYDLAIKILHYVIIVITFNNDCHC